jgi:tRNA pseudouridine55 synthase
VVAFVRKRTGVRRVGHAGTLDPAATGVLPLCLGRATRLVEYLVDATKTYVAEVTLGVTTDTYDAEGSVLATADASRVRDSDVVSALAGFRGDILQVPPVYSALKREGVPLYKRARAGEAVTLAPRPVRVDGLELLARDGPVLSLEVDCSKGFYVRSLAHDLGAALGVGAMLSGLVRSRVGRFRLEDAVPLDVLVPDLESGAWLERLVAADEVLLDWHAAILREEQALRLRNGLPVTLQWPAPGAIERCRAYGEDGRFLAVLRRAGPLDWRPAKVFA